MNNASRKEKANTFYGREGGKEEEWVRVGGRGNLVRRKIMSLVISTRAFA